MARKNFDPVRSAESKAPAEAASLAAVPTEVPAASRVRTKLISDIALAQGYLCDSDGEDDDEEAEPVEPSQEEIALEADIRRIELDIAVLDLRADLEAQEQLLATWQKSINGLAEEKREGRLYGIPWTNEDRQDEKDLKERFEHARQSVALLRERVESLEAQQRAMPVDAG
eukprot:TRINITY_DN33703_c0_g1_i1.p1 TRINITY_DN33703_c0_g1~~TRINITY_DN33703_c0_g1_i1.p1  ORF type:complete len:171 (+),score=43.33 TRINITY_DN33703_c0_g1_i1:65-577(+)